MDHCCCDQTDQLNGWCKVIRKRRRNRRNQYEAASFKHSCNTNFSTMPSLYYSLRALAASLCSCRLEKKHTSSLVENEIVNEQTLSHEIVRLPSLPESLPSCHLQDVTQEISFLNLPSEVAPDACYTKEFDDINLLNFPQIGAFENENTKSLPAFRTKNDFHKMWLSWKIQFLAYIKNIENAEMKKNMWGVLLLNRMGPVGQEIYRKFTFYGDENAMEDIDVLMKKFDIYYIFGDRTKEDGEAITKYVHDLQFTAVAHQHSDPDSIVKEKVIQDIKNHNLAEEITLHHEEKDLISYLRSLNLTDIIGIWERFESPSSQEVCEQRTSIQKVYKQRAPIQKVYKQRAPIQIVCEQRVPTQEVCEQRVPTQAVCKQRVPTQEVCEQRAPTQKICQQYAPTQNVYENSAATQEIRKKNKPKKKFYGIRNAYRHKTNEKNADTGYSE